MLEFKSPLITNKPICKLTIPERPMFEVFITNLYFFFKSEHLLPDVIYIPTIKITALIPTVLITCYIK